MRAYSVFDRAAGPAEGAVLVFAPTAAQARSLGFPALQDFCDTEWIDCAARWMEGMEVELARQNGVPPRALRVIDSPRCCARCDTWGSALDEEGICDPCRDDEEDD